MRDKLLGALIGFSQDEIAQEQGLEDRRALRRARLALLTITMLLAAAIALGLAFRHQREQARTRSVELREQVGRSALALSREFRYRSAAVKAGGLGYAARRTYR